MFVVINKIELLILYRSKFNPFAVGIGVLSSILIFIKLRPVVVVAIVRAFSSWNTR